MQVTTTYRLKIMPDWGRGIWLIFHEVHPIFHEDHPIFHEAQPSGIWDGPSGIWGGPSGIWEKSHEATSTRQNSSSSGSTSYSMRRSRVEYEVLTRVDEFCRVDGAKFEFVHISCLAEYGKWYIGIIPRWKMCSSRVKILCLPFKNPNGRQEQGIWWHVNVSKRCQGIRTWYQGARTWWHGVGTWFQCVRIWFQCVRTWF